MKRQQALALEPEDKLRWLRRLDHGHNWDFLDDKRCCRSCGRIFTGREARVIGGTRPFGRVRITCPTRDCAATPARWVSAAGTQAHAVKRSISFRNVKVVRLLRRARRGTPQPRQARFADAIKLSLARWFESFSALIKIRVHVTRLRGLIL
jgi:rubredoxin